MPIPIVQLQLADSEVIDLHCPACGTVVVPVGEDPNPCQHVEFISMPAADIVYVRADLEAIVDEWREEAEVKDEEFQLAEALSERRDDSTSFVFAISWSGMPEMLWVGFRLGTPEPDDESEDDGSEDQETLKQRTPPNRASRSSKSDPKKAKKNTRTRSRAKRKSPGSSLPR